MARITRKELKTDKFALEVEHTVDFFGQHRPEIIRYGAAAVVVVLIVVAVYFYRQQARASRQEALAQALQVLEAPVGQGPNAAGISFATAQARDQEATKRFNDLAAKYSGNDEGAIARYTLASLAADQGRMAEAEKGFKDVVESADKNYASLAKLSLAQLYFASGRVAQGEDLLRPLMDHPTILVSKDEAPLALARGIGKTKPAEARKLVDPLRPSRNSAVSQAAIQLYSEIGQ